MLWTGPDIHRCRRLDIRLVHRVYWTNIQTPTTCCGACRFTPFKSIPMRYKLPRERRQDHPSYFGAQFSFPLEGGQSKDYVATVTSSGGEMQN